MQLSYKALRHWEGGDADDILFSLNIHSLLTFSRLLILILKHCKPPRALAVVHPNTYQVLMQVWNAYTIKWSRTTFHNTENSIPEHQDHRELEASAVGKTWNWWHLQSPKIVPRSFEHYGLRCQHTLLCLQQTSLKRGEWQSIGCSQELLSLDPFQGFHWMWWCLSSVENLPMHVVSKQRYEHVEVIITIWPFWLLSHGLHIAFYTL